MKHYSLLFTILKCSLAAVIYHSLSCYGALNERDPLLGLAGRVGAPLHQPSPAVNQGEPPVEKWLKWEITRSKRNREHIPQIINVACTLARGLLYLKINYELGKDTLSPSLPGIKEANDTGQEVFSGVYGVLASVPMVALGIEGISSGNHATDPFLESLLKPRSLSEQIITRESTTREKAIRVVKATVVAPLAIISSSTLGYITYDEFSPLIHKWWVIPGVLNMYNRALMDYVNTPQLTNKIALGTVNIIREQIQGKKPVSTLISSNIGPTQDVINRITKKIHRLKNYFYSLDRERLLEFEELFSQADNGDKLRLLFKPWGEDAAPLYPSSSSESGSLGKKIAGILSGLVGVGGMWVYLPATTPGFEDILGDSEPAKQASQGLAITALLSASSIFYLAASDRAEKMWQLLSSLGRKEENSSLKYKLQRGGIAAASVFLAGLNASQIFQVEKDFTKHPKATLSETEAAAAFYSFFTISFWALDTWLVKLWQGPPSKRFITYLDMVTNKIGGMTEEALYNLDELIPE